jgi:hypothetical protein
MVQECHFKGGTGLERPLLKSILCQDDSYMLTYALVALNLGIVATIEAPMRVTPDTNLEQNLNAR